MVSAKDLENLENLLKLYFNCDEDGRFVFEKNVGHGMDSIAWRFRYRPRVPGGKRLVPKQDWRRVVLKHPRQAALYDIDFVEADSSGHDTNTDTDAEEPINQIENERNFLEILKYAKHIVEYVVIPDDPLRRSRSPLRPHRLEDWIFLEWMENGTLENFLARVLEAGIAPLPNRLLWRLFLCLIRMCIGMAWPPEPTVRQDPVLEDVRQGVTSGIVHGDIHNGNIMVDSLQAGREEKEHDLFPPLKLIDFGDAQQYPVIEGSQFDPSDEDIFDIGCTMVDLITLSNAGSEIDIQNLEQTDLFKPAKGPEVRTAGIALLSGSAGNNLVRGIDGDLADLVCLCLAIDPLQRAKLPGLVNLAMKAIEERDAVWYALNTEHPNPGMETDTTVTDILNRCILNADGSGV